MTWHPTERDVNVAARIGTAFGILLMLIVAVIYLNARNYQPVPQCHEDAVIMEIDSELICVPRAGFP